MAEALYAGATAFAVALVIGPTAIRALTRLKFGQTVRDDGPKSHLSKQGTPTMGGVLIIFALALGTGIFAPGFELVAWALFLTLSYGLIGMLDDFIIIVRRRSLGLKARYKLIAQIIIATVVALYAYVSPHISSTIIVPWGDGLIDLGPLFVPIAVFLIVGASNAVNLTDGLDGLAAGMSAIAAGAFGLIVYQAGHVDLAVFAASVVGACIGFSWFNSHPAQVFMGDTGSLALGGALASLAILSKTMFFLIPIGAVFGAETLSVMIQVISFKLRKKRVFRMAPIHHHFELAGWKETKVVIRFLIIGMFLGLAGVALYSYAARL